LLLAANLAGLTHSPEAGAAAAGYDADAALAVSQAAVGRELDGWVLQDSTGAAVDLSGYRGKPLLISMIFTSCYHVCPAITRHLDAAVGKARDAVGEESFEVVTVGFDTAVDTPEAMRQFARRQGVDDARWAFLSGSEQTVSGLVENIGFVFFPSPRGFDHINQVTVVDGEGRIYRQVYGAGFELPALVEPLKQLVFNRPEPGRFPGHSLVNRVKLFCTVYDPSSGRYRFDYSLFVGIGIGAVILLGVVAWLLLEAVRARRDRGNTGRA
jgi:protein SCO1/2